jgi:hypothetical protein
VHVVHTSSVASLGNRLDCALVLITIIFTKKFRHRDQLVREVEIKQQSNNMNTGLVLLYHDVKASYLVPEGRE